MTQNYHKSSESANSDDEELMNLLDSKVRGRHQSTASSLRIKQIEKLLSKRTDLTKQ